MRFQSEYMCRLLNVARHSAFGMQAAKMVLENVPDPPKVCISNLKIFMLLCAVESFVCASFG